jgi:hypothetical protein
MDDGVGATTEDVLDENADLREECARLRRESAKNFAEAVAAGIREDALRAQLREARELLHRIRHYWSAVPDSAPSFYSGVCVWLARTSKGEAQQTPTRPRVVCLCGSTRFTDCMLVKQWELTKAGCIVVSWCALPETYFSGPHVRDAEGVTEIVDEVHKRKIDLADEVFVLNVGGYVGESTRSEIDYAVAHNKPIKYLEPLAPQTGEGGDR